MSDETNTASLLDIPPLEMVGVSVVNTAHDGYRRAGFVLQLGENSLPSVTLAELGVLEADPRLSVTVIAANPDNDPEGGLDNPDPTDAVTPPPSTDQPPLANGHRGRK